MGHVAAQYPTMTVQELAALRGFVDKVAAPDCALAMWGTWPKLAEFMAVGEAWGFEYVTGLFVWCKVYDDPEQPRLFHRSMAATTYCGMGYYTRSGSEFCGLWKRGRPPVPKDRSVRQVLHARVREHSRKPVEARRRLERLWPQAHRLEMFAREKAHGWDAWGNEAGKFPE